MSGGYLSAITNYSILAHDFVSSNSQCNSIETSFRILEILRTRKSLIIIFPFFSDPKLSPSVGKNDFVAKFFPEASIHRCSVKKLFLKNVENSEGNTLDEISGICCNFNRTETPVQLLSCNFHKYLKTQNLFCQGLLNRLIKWE